jgi:hypothetical protein
VRASDEVPTIAVGFANTLYSRSGVCEDDLLAGSASGLNVPFLRDGADRRACDAPTSIPGTSV